VHETPSHSQLSDPKRTLPLLRPRPSEADEAVGHEDAHLSPTEFEQTSKLQSTIDSVDRLSDSVLILLMSDPKRSPSIPASSKLCRSGRLPLRPFVGFPCSVAVPPGVLFCEDGGNSKFWFIARARSRLATFVVGGKVLPTNDTALPKKQRNELR